MNKLLTSLLGISSLGLATGTAAQHITGPNSSQPPYQRVFSSVAPAGSKIVSVLSENDAVGGYRFAGIPDGIGAFDNGDSTFTVVVNHEHGNTSGVTRAHGSKGAFVSKWVIKKDPNNLQVLSGSDLIQKIHLWDKTNQLYVSYNIASGFATGLSRFCSADMPPVSAFYNAATGKGTKSRFLMNGEESGVDGRPFAHIVTGPEAGSSFDLPYLGRASWENYLACPKESDTTILIGTDDGTDGQVYVYVGIKKNTGNEIEKAGLTGGKLYGIKIASLIGESSSLVIKDSTFSLADLGAIRDIDGTAFNTLSNNNGVFKFNRPEDGAWDPRNPNDFYLMTTASTTSPSRMWRFRFNDIGNPAAGGKVTMLLTGNEGQIMMDNMGIDNWGHILIQEDQGSDGTLASTWQYTMSNGDFKRYIIHDSTKFYTGGSAFITTNEEASGIIDMQSILGPGWWMGSDQIHVAPAVNSAEIVERGQLFAYFNPDTYNSNPEINLKGNNTSIQAGTMIPAVSNNTDMGNAYVGKVVSKTFAIENAGPAVLNVTGISFSGQNAGEFTVSGASFPMTIAAGGSANVTVDFKPTAVGLRSAVMNIANNDFDEASYRVAVQGVGQNTLDVASVPNGSFMKLFPNPTKDQVTIAVTLKAAETITVSIVDLNGREVVSTQSKEYAAGEQKIQLSTEMLPGGNYFVQIAAGNAVMRTKLTVIH